MRLQLPRATLKTPHASLRKIAQRLSRRWSMSRTKNRLTTAGVYSSSEVVEGLFNSRGVAHWYEQTLAEVSITMLADNSSGWQKANSPDARQVDHVRMAEVAAQKAIDSPDPTELPPGKYTVILEPAAVLDAVGFMFWDFGGSALLEQRSFLNERIGKPIFGENITVWDDVYHPLQTGAPFDGEGMQRQRVKLIEQGTVKGGDLCALQRETHGDFRHGK